MDYASYVRSQVSPKDWKIIKKLGLTLDSKILAELWPDFVNFEVRRKTEIPFILSQLGDGYQDMTVLDSATGSGATSIGLKLAGLHSVVSNEIDEHLRAVADQEAAKYGVTLELTCYDWRALPDEWTERFDAVLCLGNSITYLFKREGQLDALRNFNRVLKKGGKLLIDERNYPKILAGDYNRAGIIYPSSSVTATPIYTSDRMVVMEYVHSEKGLRAHLVLYPFKRGELKELLEMA